MTYYDYLKRWAEALNKKRMNVPFETVMACERQRDGLVENIMRAAQLRPGPFELTATERLVIDYANRQLAEARYQYYCVPDKRMTPEQIDIEYLYLLAQQNMKEKNLIPVPEGTDGQQPQWPGDGHAPESGTDTTEKTDSTPEGTRKPEHIHIPIVR